MSSQPATATVGSCHCGAVRITLPHAPDWVGACNCSLCSKLGTLWAYYPDADVAIDGATDAYVWGTRSIGIHHCRTCGCVTHWRTLGRDFGRMGINARLLEGFAAETVEIRLLDNAAD